LRENSEGLNTVAGSALQGYRSARRRGRPHYSSTLWNISRVIFCFVAEIVSNLPELAALRRRRRRSAGEPAVAIVSDNLDEVNGIALSSRVLVEHLRRQGRKVHLVGVAFHTRRPRIERGGVLMLPARCSIDLPGYHQSEFAVPRFALLLRLLRRYQVDLVELETPGALGLLALLAARVAGIRTVAHYRTDVLAFSEVLISNVPARRIIQFSVRLFTRLSGSVIVPSKAVGEKLRKVGIPPARINHLPRGVDLDVFHPEMTLFYFP
jgi:glycosyltransferase involved in cell wall biosynthesis